MGKVSLGSARVRRVKRAVLVGSALLWLVAPDAALAQASRVGDTFAVPYVPYPQYWPKRFPAVAFDSANGVYLTVAGNGTVGGAFVSADGAPLGAPFAIVAGTAGQAPSLAYSPDAGAFLVAWLDTNTESSVWGQMWAFGAGGVGTPVTGPFMIALAPGGAYSEVAPAVAYSTASKEFLVAWHQGLAIPRWDDIRAQRVSNAGQLIGPEVVITADQGVWQTQPGIGYNPVTNEFYVAWSGEANGAATIEAQRVQAGTGALVGSRTTLATGPFLTLPKVQYNSATGRLFVAWYFEKPRGLYGRFIKPDGSFDGDIIPLSTAYFAYDATHQAYNPVSNTFFVVTHSGDAGGPEDYGFEVSALGTPSPALQVTAAGGTGNFYPAIAAHAQRAEWMVVTSNTMTTIMGQRLSTLTRDPSGPANPPAPPPTPPPTPPPPTATYTLTVRVGSQVDVESNIPAGSVRTIQPATGAIPAGSVFAGWTGDGDCYDGSLTLVRDITCTAVLNSIIAVQPGATWERALDLTGDGAGDLFLYSGASGGWFMAHHNLSGGFTYAEGQWQTLNLQVRAARLNGDSLTDFVLYNSDTGQWWQAINTGRGSFIYTTATWGPGWVVHVGRFNNTDPFDDVLVYRPSTGEWAVTFADGSGGFGHAPVARFTPAGWDIHLADFDGDDVTDLFLYNPSTGQWWKGINNRSGAFAWADTGTWSPGWMVKVGDFDGNDRADIFVYHASIGAWYVCLSPLSGVSGFSYVPGSWSPAWQVYVTNLDGNASDDIFVYSPTTGYWFECYSTGTGGFSYFGESFRGQPTWDLSVTDFNGDGLGDLFIYSPTTGQWYKGVNVKGVNPWQEGGFIWSAPGAWSPGFAILAGR